MKFVRLSVLSALVGTLVALIYFFFEQMLHHMLHFVWIDVVNTDQQRIWVAPICIGLTIAYFGAMHLLDSGNEHHESHGLGELSEVSLRNIVKVLFIGFLSLLAGASLGPEAVLVPACIMAGSYIGKHLAPGEKNTSKLLGLVGFVALFTAFFSSFLVGLLSLVLVKRQFKQSLSPAILILASIAAGSSFLTLNYLENPSYVSLPSYSWSLNLITVPLVILLLGVGYLTTYLLDASHRLSDLITNRFIDHMWLHRALLAGGVLTVLYLLGGNLVEFTGNQAIIPMLQRAPELGLVGLVWILIIKLLAIGWSRASGYRGGLIFPMVFAASVIVAIVQLYVAELNPIYALVAVVVGIFLADHKLKVLV